MKDFTEAADQAFKEESESNLNYWTIEDDDPESQYWKKTWKAGAEHGHNEAMKELGWIDVKHRLPNFHERVIWRGLLKWRRDHVSIFDDSLNGETEVLEYGGFGYCLTDNSDYLAVPSYHDCDEILTHWMPIPKID